MDCSVRLFKITAVGALSCCAASRNSPGKSLGIIRHGQPFHAFLLLSVMYESSPTLQPYLVKSTSQALQKETRTGFEGECESG